MRPDGSKLKTYSLLACMVLFGSLGNVLLSRGMKQVGAIVDYSPAALSLVFLKTFTAAPIWLGVGSNLLFLVCYLLLLSWADFTFVQPVSAIGYALVAVLSYLLLGEIISPVRWLGVLFICAGVALVSGTRARTVGD